MAHGVNITWPQYVDTFFFWPIIFILFTAVCCFPLQLLYSWLFIHVKRFRHFLHQHVGTPDMPRVDCPALNSLFYMLQVVCSSIVVAIWWNQSYTHGTTVMERSVHDVANLFFLTHWFYRYLQNAFSFDACFRLDTFIDAVTVVPEILGKRQSGLFDDYNLVDWDERWISMKFLRVLRVAQAYTRFEATLNIQALPLRIVRTVLTTFALIVSMAGFVFNVALLGEIPGWADTFISTGMGNISPIMMFYWMVTTISTVGYGDFAPSTGPSQMLIVGCIFIGCTFFATQVSTFVELLSDVSSGKGRYVRRFAATHHIIVVGSGVGKYSCFLAEFLNHVLQRQYLLGELPDVVLLSETGFAHDLREFIQSSLAQEKRNHISLLVGSVILREDLDRVHTKAARAVYIVPDVASSDRKTIDGENIMRAVYLKQCFPTIPVNLMLLEAPSRQRVLDMRINGLSAFSIGQMKATLFANSCRIKGFMPLLASCLQRPGTDTTEVVLSQLRKAGKDGETYDAYVESLDWTIHAFVAGDKFVGNGRPFSEASAVVWETSRGKILFFAALLGGRIVLNYNGSIDGSLVLIALCRTHGRIVDDLHEVSSMWDFILEASTERVNSQSPPEEFHAHAKLKRFELGANPASGSALELGQSEGQTSTEVKNPFSEPERDHVIVAVVPNKRIWSQVECFVKALRHPQLPVAQPILVISAVEIPKPMLDDWSAKGVQCIYGQLQKLEVFQEAQVHRCHALVAFCDAARSETVSGEIYADSETITSVSTIEEVLHEHFDSTAFCIYDFSTTDGLRFVHEHMNTWRRGVTHSAMRLPGDDDEGTQHLENEAKVWFAIVQKSFRSVMKPFYLIFSFWLNLIPLLFAKRNVRLECDPPHRKLVFQDLFASGRALTPEIFGTLFGNCYHAPFTLALVNALCMTDPYTKDSEASFLIQTKCPQKWVGMNFGDLQTAWLRASDSEFQSCGPMMVLAVFRHIEDDNVNGYNITVPEWSFILKGTDLLTVLARYEFGQLALSKDLLNGEPTTFI